VKVLIVNADDFGHSDTVNAGIAEAHERGIVTSASLMVRRGGAEDAAAYARSHPVLGVGLHVDLGEWRYRNGPGWVPSYEVEDSEVQAEVRRQVAEFRDLTGRDPTHLDSHQHVHLREPARSAVLDGGRELHVPVRHFDEKIRYRGDFYGQTDRGDPLPEAVTAVALTALIRSLADGITELVCHPGKRNVPGTSYAVERSRELEALCDPRVKTAIEAAGVTLSSFARVQAVPWTR
jgi:chitin disaccharide deacetylase